MTSYPVEPAYLSTRPVRTFGKGGESWYSAIYWDAEYDKYVVCNEDGFPLYESRSFAAACDYSLSISA